MVADWVWLITRTGGTRQLCELSSRSNDFVRVMGTVRVSCVLQVLNWADPVSTAAHGCHSIGLLLCSPMLVGNVVLQCVAAPMMIPGSDASHLRLWRVRLSCAHALQSCGRG